MADRASSVALPRVLRHNSVVLHASFVQFTRVTPSPCCTRPNEHHLLYTTATRTATCRSEGVIRAPEPSPSVRIQPHQTLCVANTNWRTS